MTTKSPASFEDVDSLRAECDRLRAVLAEKTLEAEGLSAELAETNTGVVALYSELDRQAIQLREATELKSRFLAYMSHEFRTPLGAIISITRILLSRLDGPLTSEQDKQASFVLESASELLQMVSDLLDLAKVEAGKITISPAWFDMLNLFEALRGMFKPMQTAESVPIIFEEPVGVSRVYSDDRKVAQILRNLISNAIKFTEKGEIRITAKRTEENTIIFSVRDTGIGIAREHQAALFRDYLQVDSPIQKRLRGIGLGLSLSKQFATLLGGTIWVESELGVGSVFSLQIPETMSGEEGQSSTTSVSEAGK